MNIAYLSCPFSHPDPTIKELRYRIATQVAYELMQKGVMVYSPLTHNVPIDRLGIKGDWLTWKDFDHAMVSRCERMIVIKIEGWESSKGVAAEIECAQALGRPIEWLEPSEETVSLANSQSAQSLENFTRRLLHFREERDWEQYHSPKNLAMNLGVETGELMEHFRWLTEAQSRAPEPSTLSDIRDEIGDVVVSLVLLAHALGIDPIQAAHQKLSKIAERYPADKCRGLSHKYTAYTATE